MIYFFFSFAKNRSKKTSIVHGRCRQGSLPRLTYVYHSKDSGRSGGNPYFQDLVLMPSNCECLISLPPFDSIRDNDDGTIVSESLNEEENSPILTSSMQGSQPIIAGSLPINWMSNINSTTRYTKWIFQLIGFPS